MKMRGGSRDAPPRTGGWERHETGSIAAPSAFRGEKHDQGRRFYYWYGSTNRLQDQTCYASTDLKHWTYKGIVLDLDVETNRIDVVYKESGTNAQHGIWLLSPDYLGVESRVFLWNTGGCEAPMIFRRNGTYYYATSATAWTVSTSTRYYSATSLSGPWSPMTNLHIWLPVTFSGNVPSVDYHQDWDLNLEEGTWRA